MNLKTLLMDFSQKNISYKNSSEIRLYLHGKSIHLAWVGLETEFLSTVGKPNNPLQATLCGVVDGAL